MRLFARVAPAALMFLAGLATVGQAQQGSTKIAYVNAGAVLQVAPGRAEAEATYQKEAAAYSAELQKMGDSLNTLITDYQKAEPTLTAAQKETRTKSIRTFQGELQSKQGELQQKAAERESELMAPIMEQVKKVLDDIRAEDGYSLILAADPTLILSADKNLDITDRVVARLRTLSASKPAPKAGTPVSTPAGVTRPKPPTR